MNDNPYSGMTIADLMALREKLNDDLVAMLEKQRVLIDEVLCMSRGKPVGTDSNQHPQAQEETSQQALYTHTKG